VAPCEHGNEPLDSGNFLLSLPTIIFSRRILLYRVISYNNGGTECVGLG
jgi:hypothetical protein